MTTSPCSRAVLQRLVVQASTKRNPGTGSRKTEILSAFCVFSSLCAAEKFPPLSRRRRAGAPPPWISDRDRAHRRPSSTLEADREPSDREQRRSRVAPSSSALGVPPARGPGSHKIKIPSAFSEFSRPCKAENFRSGRNAVPLVPDTDARPLPETGASPLSHALAHRRTRTRGDAGLVASIRTLSSWVMSRLRDRDGDRVDCDHSTNSSFQKTIFDLCV